MSRAHHDELTSCDLEVGGGGTAGVSRRASLRELQEVTGASLPNFGYTVLPSVEENKCCAVIGHPTGRCNMDVGRWRRTASSVQGALLGGFIHPSLTRPGSSERLQISCVNYLYVFMSPPCGDRK